MEPKHTEGEHYAVEYCGRWELQDGPYYGDYDLLDEENYPKEAAKNAQLYAAAPYLLSACLEMMAALDVRPVKPIQTKRVQKAEFLIRDAVKKATE